MDELVLLSATSGKDHFYGLIYFNLLKELVVAGLGGYEGEGAQILYGVTYRDLA